MAFHKDVEELLDALEGGDDLAFKKLYYLNCHKSVVFDPEIFLTDVITKYPSLMRKMTPLTEDKGIFKKIVQLGDGTFPAPNADILIHFNAFLEGKEEPYDTSTVRRNQVFKLSELGELTQFPGFRLAVQSMQYREVAKFLFTPNYFYGQTGCPPKIPPGSAALFFIEIRDPKNVGGVDDVYELSPEKLQQLNCLAIVEKIEQIQDSANVKFNSKNYEEAVDRYALGLKILEEYCFGSAEEIVIKRTLKLTLLSNLIQCYMLLKDHMKALQVCKLATCPDMPRPKNSKLHFRYAKVLMLKGDMEGAAKILLEGLNIEPQDHDLNSLANEVKGTVELEMKTLEATMALMKHFFRQIKDFEDQL